MSRSPALAALLLVALGMAVLIGAAGVGAAQGTVIQGEPDVDAYASDNILMPGTDTELEVQLANDGTVTAGGLDRRDKVTTARNTRVEVTAGDAPVVIDTARQSVGSITEDQPTTVPIDITIPEGAEPGTYELEAEIQYSYTSSYYQTGGVENEAGEIVTRDIEIVIDDAPRFRLETLESDVQVGESGTLDVAVENVGSQPATGVDVELVPTGSMVNFGGGDGGTARVQSLAPGERETVQYDLTVSSDAVGNSGYSLDGSVTFTDQHGVRDTDDRAALSAGVYPAPERDDFIVETQTESITAGGTVPVEVSVTNNRNEVVTDIEGKLFTDDPLDSGDDEAFAGSLEPGEETTMTFELSAAGGATAKVFPISMDFRYDDDDGDSRVSDTYRVPIAVTQPEDDGGLPFLLIGGPLGGMVLLGGGYWYTRGRTSDN